MNTLLDDASILVGMIINIPILYFFWHNWLLRKENGLVILVRNMTMWWVLAFFIRHNFTLIDRFVVSSGGNVNTPVFLVLSFMTNVFVAMMTIYGGYVFYLLSKKTRP